MALGLLNLLDATKSHGNDMAIGLIEDVVTSVPEFDRFMTRVVAARTFKTLTRTGLPTVGFRQYNQGTDPTKSTFTQKDHSMQLISARVEADAVLAQEWEGGESAYFALEAAGVMKAALIKLGAQTWYGRLTGGDAAGFPGLKEFTAFGSSVRVLNATGTTVGGASSAYFVKFGMQAVHHIFGNSTTLALGDRRIGDATDSNGKKFTAIIRDLNAHVGLFIGSQYSVGRIANLTTENGKGLTDTLVAEALSKFPVGWAPDAIFCSRQQRYQLQKSRQNTNQNVGVVMGPIPTESMGIPLIATDSIGDTDAIES